MQSGFWKLQFYLFLNHTIEYYSVNSFYSSHSSPTFLKLQNELDGGVGGVGVLSQCVQLSNYHDLHFKYFIFYLPIYYNKAGEKKHKNLHSNSTSLKLFFPCFPLSPFILWYSSSECTSHGCPTNQSSLSPLNFLLKSLPLMHSNYHYNVNGLQIMSFPDPFQVPIPH